MPKLAAAVAPDLAGLLAPSRLNPDPSARTMIIASSGVLLFVSFGIAYAVPAFFPILRHTFHCPVWHLAALFSITGAVYYLLGLISGPIADRIGARVVAITGQLTLAAGLLAASFAATEAEFDLACIIAIGVGVGSCFVPVVGAVQAFCRDRPALAGGIAASGIGAGTLVMPPLANMMITEFGWRSALRLLALIAVVGIVSALPLGPSLANARTAQVRHERRGVAGPFAFLYAAQLCVSLVAFVPLAHLTLLAKADGWSSESGVYLISLVGIGSVGGRALLGLVAEGLGSCRTACLCTALMSLSLTGLAFFPQFWQLGLVAVFYGIGYGGTNALTGPIVAEILGLAGICRSVGLVATSRALGILIGPWAVGLASWRLGGYQVPFLLCAGLAGIAALLFARLRCHRLPSGANPGAR